jgi:energy-coupling factor transporter ATP-binding protein EcfA2
MRTNIDTHPHARPQSVPLLVFIGPPGAGKSSAARELSRLLEETRVGVAYVDRDEFGTDGLLHEDPLLSLNEMLHARVAGGAERLVVAWRVESGLELARFRSALGWADITVCRLSAPVATLMDRIASGQSEFQRLHLQTMAREIAPRLERQASEDILLATDEAAPAAVAMRALRQWTMRGAPVAAAAGA